jgi:glucose/arabinose dehydrogenase/PKD repeat protein
MSTDFVFTTNPVGSSGTFQNETLISGLDLPVAVKFLPNGDMLILQLGGQIRRVPAGTTQVSPTPFLTLTNIGTVNGQQGLMDLVLDPSFGTNRYYYIFYTLGSPNRDRVSRFTATADFLGTVAGSETVLYQDPETADAEHHGGALNFGGDGKLYITTGEHFDPANAQSLTSPRGKILRVNADGTIPTDNPFYDGAGPNRDDIWALGLRNPFRAFFDSPSGKLYVADVGGNNFSTAQEEVNVAVRGANYGWPNCEGSSCGSNPAYTSPIHSYPHNGRDASITGGFIYRGSQFPAEYVGNYFFADYTQNWIKRLTFNANGTVSGVFNFEPPDGVPDGPYGDIVYLTQGPDGALYYVDLGFSDTTGESGISRIRRIRFIWDNAPPTATASASPTEGPAPLTVNFSSAGSVDPEEQTLTYLWSFGDGDTSTEPNPAHTYTHTGQYTVQLTVSDGVVSSSSAPLAIVVGNKPVPNITSPADGLFFRGGDTIAVTGDATDIEDGELPATAFTWAVDFLHAGHVHPGLPTVGAKSFVFEIPATGHDFSGDTRYRITLSVTDSDGLQASQFVVIHPDKVNLDFDSVPSGLVINIDGLAHTTPFVYDTLVNFTHTIQAPNQIVGPTSYTFTSWSDGGAQQHTLTVPAAQQSYIASYSAGPALPPGLVAGYRLDQTTGTTAPDISANNTTGTLVNAPAWTTGKYGNALSFSGNNYVDLGNPTSLRLTGSMTLSAWINISANPFDDGAIVGKLSGAGWQLKTSPDTGVRTAAVQVSSNGSNSIQRYSNTVLATNTWYHVAGVYDATARTLDIYINGVLDNGVLSGTVPAAQTDANVNVNIAQRTGIPGTFNFQGRIDEVHVFNRALSASEIQIDMNVQR